MRLELIKLSKQKGKKNKRDTKCEGCSIYFMRLAGVAMALDEDVETWWKCGACKKQYCMECKRKFTADLHARACTANRKNAYQGHQHSLYTKHTHTKHSLTHTHTHTHTCARAHTQTHTHKHNTYSKREFWKRNAGTTTRFITYTYIYDSTYARAHERMHTYTYFSK